MIMKLNIYTLNRFPHKRTSNETIIRRRKYFIITTLTPFANRYSDGLFCMILFDIIMLY